jgi:hypothetical protein
MRRRKRDFFHFRAYGWTARRRDAQRMRQHRQEELHEISQQWDADLEDRLRDAPRVEEPEQEIPDSSGHWDAELEDSFREAPRVAEGEEEYRPE